VAAIVPGRRNEALDCRVYARAAAAICGIDRWPEARWRELERHVGREEYQAPARSERSPEPTPSPARRPNPCQGWLPNRHEDWSQPRQARIVVELIRWSRAQVVIHEIADDPEPASRSGSRPR
jgi:phage terminase large subunit GpA-like protein